MNMKKISKNNPLQLTIKFMTQPKRYSKEELEFFKGLIITKLARAEESYRELKNSITGADENSTDDTGWSFKPDDGSNFCSKEEASILAKKQEVYIQSLKQALGRISNGTYGICAKTGNLISKERLIAVPNTTLSLLVKSKID
jgi:DnaK suppressor protein